MSIQLAILNTYLRWIEKPLLARAPDDAMRLRAGMKRTADRVFRWPETVRQHGDFVPGPYGSIECVWIIPDGAPQDRMIIHFHGGAFLMGSPATHRHLAAALAERTGLRVLLPHYRLAPEHPFPAAVEDAQAVWQALLDRGLAPSRIGLTGDSAGGGLALALLHILCTRDAGRPGALALMSPWTDMTLSGESYERNVAREAMLPFPRIAQARDIYMDGRPADDPTASPLFGTFPGAPPVLIHGSGAEVLEDDARLMAARLERFDADVTLEMWNRTPHCWHMFHGWLPEADEALDRIGAFLRHHLDAEALEKPERARYEELRPPAKA